MILRNRDSGFIDSINRGSEYGIEADSVEPLDYEDEVFISCTDTTARYIEKLPEIVELLKRIATPGDEYINDDIDARAIITYAEGNDG